MIYIGCLITLERSNTSTRTVVMPGLLYLLCHLMLRKFISFLFYSHPIIHRDLSSYMSNINLLTKKLETVNQLSYLLFVDLFWLFLLPEISNSSGQYPWESDIHVCFGVSNNVCCFLSFFLIKTINCLYPATTTATV